ncbi:Phosphomannomutase [Galdieria sulphuraria]|nr:Phosphomannomutase [Galdieria sulphuraria]
MPKRTDTLALFDVDGTLTPSRCKASHETLEFLRRLRDEVFTGIVGGSDLVKQEEQLGPTILEDFDYVFSENGLVAYEKGKLIHVQSLAKHLGEEKLKNVINCCLRYIADLDIPLKRGTFVEFRKGMLNVSPIGRNCSQQEREEFEKYDRVHSIRSRFVDYLKERFEGYDLQFSIGGQISFDVFPRGWDKTYCLSFVKHIPVIHFFGDKTFLGGNDYEIFQDARTIGHSVTSPEDTVKQCQQLFNL